MLNKELIKKIPQAPEIRHLIQRYEREHISGVYYYVHSKDFTQLSKAIRRLVVRKLKAVGNPKN